MILPSNLPPSLGMSDALTNMSKNRIRKLNYQMLYCTCCTAKKGNMLL